MIRAAQVSSGRTYPRVEKLLGLKQEAKLKPISYSRVIACSDKPYNLLNQMQILSSKFRLLLISEAGMAPFSFQCYLRWGAGGVRARRERGSLLRY